MITVTILTKNSEKYLEEVLQALTHFDEVLLYDNGSTDRTFEIAEKFPNVVVKKGPFLGFGPSHNEASRLATNDWILSIDSDEVVTPELTDELLSLKLDPGCVYSFPRHNYYNGKWIRWCGWYPDRQYRLYHRKRTAFTEAQVHEAVKREGMRHVPLKHPIKHYSYDSISDFLKKMESYSSLFAEQNKGKKKANVFSAIGHGVGAFLRAYVIKRGFLGGFEGFLISVYNGHTAFYKYLKLREANAKGEYETSD